MRESCKSRALLQAKDARKMKRRSRRMLKKTKKAWKKKARKERRRGARSGASQLPQGAEPIVHVDEETAEAVKAYVVKFSVTDRRGKLQYPHILVDEDGVLTHTRII